MSGSDVRNYSLILQVVLTVFGEDDEDWDGIEANIEDPRSYTLLAPWETDVIAVIRNDR